MLANFQQTKISAPPNINEPIGIDQMPDGRILQTVRDGRIRLHDPVTGTSTVIATIPVYTNSEDGLYGPAFDNNFAENQWVYFYYSPVNMDGNSGITGKPFPATTPNGNAPTAPSATLDVWDPWTRLLPALALQVRRRAEPDDRPRERAEDHEGRGRPRRVLPRGR